MLIQQILLHVTINRCKFNKLQARDWKRHFFLFFIKVIKLSRLIPYQYFESLINSLFTKLYTEIFTAFFFLFFGKFSNDPEYFSQDKFGFSSTDIFAASKQTDNSANFFIIEIWKGYIVETFDHSKLHIIVGNLQTVEQSVFSRCLIEGLRDNTENCLFAKFFRFICFLTK